MSQAGFAGRVLVLGCGAVGQCTIPMLSQIPGVPAERVTVMDFVDNRGKIRPQLEAGMRYVQKRITRENYASVLGEYLSAGDLFIDLSWNVNSLDLLQWCRDHGVFFTNTSFEVWEPYADARREDPRRYTLYARQMDLRAMVQRWGANRGPSAVIDHGANPGLVSHFTKRALLEIGEKVCALPNGSSDRRALERALADRDFRHIAQLSGVKVIHISERDTQISNLPKAVNEFVNTWSIDGLFEEAVAPSELGWGTHEKQLPADAWSYEEGPRNQICLSSLGMNTWARSWVPDYEIIGMIIRHGEAFGISDRLTVWEGERAIYRPTVHYVYCPSDATIASLHELRMRRYELQSNLRIMSDEITSGEDRLGVLLMGHALKSWWIGSLLDINEARRLAPGQNATTLQVAVTVLAGVCWMLKHPNAGVLLPDDLDHDEILEIAMPWLGRFISSAVDWAPASASCMPYDLAASKRPEPDGQWQFVDFRL